jgi:hypothetical protein
MRRRHPRRLDDLDGAVVVAVVSVRIVQMTVDQVAGVVAVGNSLVTAARTVDVTFFMPVALVT